MNKSYSNMDPAISDYVCELYAREEAPMKEIRMRAAKAGLPDIHVSMMDGLHLEILARASGAKKAVEVGTLAGYSGVCIARALPGNGKLYTFEYEPRHAEVARETFKKAGVSNKVQILVGTALKNLKKIESKGPFDFMFIDADKVSYHAYLDWAAKNLRVGGVFAADNTFGFGFIAKPEKINDGWRAENVRALRKFNEIVARHPRFRTTILPTGEGLTAGVKVR